MPVKIKTDTPYQTRCDMLRDGLIKKLKQKFDNGQSVYLNPPVKMMLFNGDAYRDFYTINILELNELCFDSLCALADKLNVK